MNDSDTKTADLNEGLEYVKELPGFEKGHPHYYNDPMIDHFLEICLQLAGEIWVNRDRQMVIEHLLATEGKVTPDMIESFRPDSDMKDEMRRARQVFTQRIFGSLYGGMEESGQPEFLRGIVREE